MRRKTNSQNQMKTETSKYRVGIDLGRNKSDRGAWCVAKIKPETNSITVLQSGLIPHRDECVSIDIPNDKTGWQPIETAPRDGTYILLAGPSGYTTTPLRVEVCRYCIHNKVWKNHANNWFIEDGEEPTHWMPLPEMPTLTKE